MLREPFTLGDCMDALLLILSIGIAIYLTIAMIDPARF